MAETISVTCPECDKKFKTKPEKIGKKVRCPECEEAFVVPEPRIKEKKPAKPEPPPVPLAPAEPEPPADEDDANPYGVAQGDTSIRCPNCTQPMKSEKAIICIYCGYNTLTREMGRTEKYMGITFGHHFLWLLPGLLAALFMVLAVLYTLFHSLVLPRIFTRGWKTFLVIEPLRLWVGLITLAIIWFAGNFVFVRLVLDPKPPDIEKDD